MENEKLNEMIELPDEMLDAVSGEEIVRRLQDRKNRSKKANDEFGS